MDHYGLYIDPILQNFHEELSLKSVEVFPATEIQDILRVAKQQKQNIVNLRLSLTVHLYAVDGNE